MVHHRVPSSVSHFLAQCSFPSMSDLGVIGALTAVQIQYAFKWNALNYQFYSWITRILYDAKLANFITQDCGNGYSLQHIIALK